MFPFRPNTAPQFNVVYPATNNPAQANRDMFNAIEYARDEDFLKLLETVLSQGASINARNHMGLDVLTVAVNANQPHKVQTLLAKGADLPDVSADGKDLLMVAAENGSAELVSVLINIARLDINACDCHRQTALHYAVISGSKETAETLLENNADVNACSNDLQAAGMHRYLAANLEISDVRVTPLMIASFQGDSDMVELLFEYDPDPHIGICFPLTIAMHNDDAETMFALIKNDADPFHARDANGNSLLKNALIHKCSIECLRLIVQCMPTRLVIGDCNSSLGIAVQNGDEQAVALLLSKGYSPQNQEHTNGTIWDIAFDLGNGPKILAILAASRRVNLEGADVMLMEQLLPNIPQLALCSADLASEGFFPEIFTKVLPQLSAPMRIEAGAKIPPDAQLALHAAYILFHFSELEKVSDKPVHPAIKDVPPDVHWIAEIPAKQARQARLMLTAASKLVADLPGKLQKVLSLDFFLQSKEACSEGTYLSTVITQKLREEEGFPDALAKAIGSAWGKAGNKTVLWGVAPNSLEEANRFVAHIAASLLEIELEKIDANGNPLLDECKSYLQQKLHEQARPLASFCSNPVAWLRNQENRHNLQAVNETAMTKTTQIELGLSPALCERIVEGWSQAIRHAQQSKTWRNSMELQRLLSSSLAHVLNDILQAGANNQFRAELTIPASRRLQLLAWCEEAEAPVEIAPTNARGNQPANNALRRPAEGEAPGAPPEKRQRTE